MPIKKDPVAIAIAAEDANEQGAVGGAADARPNAPPPPPAAPGADGGAIPRQHPQPQPQPLDPEADRPAAPVPDRIRRPYSPVRYVNVGPLPGQERSVLARDLCFSGDPSKNEISPRSLVQEVDSRMYQSGWTEEEATRFFRTCLRDQAADWYDQIHTFDRAEPLAWRNNWTSNARSAFLNYFDAGGESFLVRATDIKPVGKENPSAFAMRVQRQCAATIRYVITQRPPHYNPRLPPNALAAVLMIPEPHRARLREAIEEVMRQQVYEDIEWAAAAMTRFLTPDPIARRHPLLAAELRRQNRVLDKPETPKHIAHFLRTFADRELLNGDVSNYVAAVQINDGAHPEDDSDPDDTAAPACPVGRRPRGKARRLTNRQSQPPKPAPLRRSQPPYPEPQCEFCQRPGHVEKDCRAKQRMKERFRANQGSSTNSLRKAAAVDVSLEGLGGW